MAIGPFTFSYCKECGNQSSSFSGGVRLNIRDEIESKGARITMFEGAPSVQKTELIAAVEHAKTESLTNASSQFMFNPETRQVRIVGTISSYHHDCDHGNPIAHMMAKMREQLKQQNPTKNVSPEPPRDES